MSRALTVPTVVAVRGQATAFGLRWESIAAQSPKAASAQLLRLMKSQQIRYAVLNESDGKRFVGGLFATTATQRVSRTYSAVVWLADVRKKPALVIAELGPGLLWVGVIDPGVWLAGDFVGSKEDAASAIDVAIEHFDRIGLTPDVLVCQTRPDGSPMAEYPITTRLAQLLASRGDPDPDFISWETLLSGAPPRDALIGQLTGVNARTSWAIIGVAGVAACVFLAHTLWTSYQAEQERLRMEAEMAQMDAQSQIGGLAPGELEAERAKRKSQAIAAALQRHTATPAPLSVIERCVRSLRGIGVQLQGWAMSELSCDGVQVIGNWSAPPQAGILTLAELALRQLGASAPKTLAVDPTGRFITAEWQLDTLVLRDVLRVHDLPVEADFRRALVTRSQLQSAGSGFAIAPWIITQPEPADITYLDPELEADANNPARFVLVPPPEGFRVALLSVAGAGSWRLTQLPVDLRAVTIRRIVFRPAPSVGAQDVIPWSLEAEYVVQ